jgi:hypothetical protein
MMLRINSHDRIVEHASWDKAIDKVGKNKSRYYWFITNSERQIRRKYYFVPKYYILGASKGS